MRTRIAQFEMAYRMQMSVPELTDFSDEDEKTLALYGDDGRLTIWTRGGTPPGA